MPYEQVKGSKILVSYLYIKKKQKYELGIPVMDGDGRMLVLLVPPILEHIRCSKTSWRSFSKSTCWGADSICYLYQVVLDSDAGLFGGFGRIHHEAEHFTTVSFVAHDIAFGTQMSTCSWQKMWANFCYNIGHYLQDCSHDNRPHSFSVYTPSRTCVVYAPAEW